VTFDHPPINTSIAEMVGEQVVVELVAATIEAQQRCEVWSRRWSPSLAGVSRTSAHTTAFGAKATAPPAARQPSWRRSNGWKADAMRRGVAV
jgi:hypothetical protein